MRWLRKAAENSLVEACVQLGSFMYKAKPYAREVGQVREPARVATPAGFMEGHDVPPDVMTGVVHWYRKGGSLDPSDLLDELRRRMLEGDKYCHNEGCEVVGHLKEFKVCPQCKSARYCATRARNKTGHPVSTRRRVAHSQLKQSKSKVSAPAHA